MAFLVTVVTSGPAQVSIFPTFWLIVATIISSRGLGCIDPSGQVRALKPEAAKVAIATILIVPTLLVVLARFVGLGGLGTMRKHGLYLLEAEQKGALVPGVILSRF